MIDIDLYNTNQSVEELLESLKLNLRKDYSPIKLYIYGKPIRTLVTKTIQFL